MKDQIRIRHVRTAFHPRDEGPYRLPEALARSSGSGGTGISSAKDVEEMWRMMAEAARQQLERGTAR